MVSPLHPDNACSIGRSGHQRRRSIIPHGPELPVTNRDSPGSVHHSRNVMIAGATYHHGLRSSAVSIFQNKGMGGHPALPWPPGWLRVKASQDALPIVITVIGNSLRHILPAVFTCPVKQPLGGYSLHPFPDNRQVSLPTYGAGGHDLKLFFGHFVAIF